MSSRMSSMSSRMSLGKVSSTLRGQLLSQVDQHGVVVWYDPGGDYEHLAAEFDLAETTMARYDGSFFALRHEIEPLLASETRPRLVVYVACSREDSKHALVELEEAGVVLQPGQQPPTRNTRLAVVAGNALQEVLAADHLDSVARQVEQGKLDLAELDGLAEGGAGADSALLTVIFGTTNPMQMALALLSDSGVDGEIKAKDAVADLRSVLDRAFELELPDVSTPAELRDQLAGALLSAELRLSLGEDAELQVELPVPRRRDACRAVLDLVTGWRNRRDLQASYLEQAGAVEAELALAFDSLPATLLERVETFPGIDDALRAVVEQQALESPDQPLLELALARQEGFWASVEPRRLERWALLASILRVMIAAGEVRAAVSQAELSADDLVARYLGQGENEGWCALDTGFRHMERRFRMAELDLAGADSRIELLVARARSAYSETSAAFSERFCDALQACRFSVTALPRQNEIFLRWVEPAVQRGRTAYLLVDGLRWEMAQELRGVLGDDLETELHPGMAQLPTLTDIGMSALLPHAQQRPRLVSGSSGKLLLELDGKLLRSRSDRLSYLERHAGCSTVVLKLEELLPASARRRQAITGAQLVVVTATDELDGLCEKANTAMAHRLMDDVLVQLRRGIRTLLDLGVETVIVTADHGFLLGEELASGDTIDPPGGETAGLHRRVWAGRGGAGAGQLRVTAAELGLESDLELVFPRGLGCFRVGRPLRAYCHGGISPQEVLIPVLEVSRTGHAAPVGGPITWNLALGSKVISSPFVSVHLEGRGDGLFGITPPVVRVEVREGRRVISSAISAAYGFDEATGDVAMDTAKQSVEQGRELRRNTVVLRLDPLPSAATVTVVVLDANSEQQLATINKVPVALSGI